MADDGIQIDSSIEYQYRKWRVERVGWVVMAVLLVLVFLGITGQGFLSERSARSADGRVQVDYDALMRKQARDQLQVRAAVTPGEPVRLALPNDFFDKLAIEAISPEPDTVTTDGEIRTYEFSPSPGATSIEVAIAVRPQYAGSVSGEVLLLPGSSAGMSAWVLP
jgi:hypothetical protein